MTRKRTTITGTPLDYVPLERATGPATKRRTATTGSASGGAFKTTKTNRVAGYAVWAAAILFVVAIVWAAP